MTTDMILTVHNNLGDGNEQLKDKCIVVYNMFFFGFLTDNAIAPYIERFSEGPITQRRCKNLEKSLVALISKGVANMGANLLISGLPQSACLRDSDIKEDVTCTHIYDTLEQFATPKKVIKMSNHTYMAIFDNIEDAELVAKSINGMLMSGTPVSACVVKNNVLPTQVEHEFRDLRVHTTFNYYAFNIIYFLYFVMMAYLALRYKSNIVPPVNAPEKFIIPARFLFNNTETL